MNRVRLQGRIEGIRQRWMPDGSQAIIADLILPRPMLGPTRATTAAEQPLPLRAEGDAAACVLARQGQEVCIEGQLRRRYYSRDGEPSWGQVEIWVDRCQPAGPATDEEQRHG